MPTKNAQLRMQHNKDSRERLGKRPLNTTLDAATAAALDKAAEHYGSKAGALRELLRPWMDGNP